MPFSVLKRHTGERKIEVLGEFDSEDEATAFAEDARLCDPENEYSVEPPPTPPKPEPPKPQS